MRWTKEFRLLAAITLVSAIAAAKKTQQLGNTAMFERTFRTLHEEPTPANINERATRANPQFLWINQKLDNFNDSDTRSWQMRYIANDEFYVEGGPLFVYVGGEWTISTGYMTAGHFYDMAKEHNGYLFYTEHRYYGESRPTSDMEIENMKYLDVRQALADLAHFIEEMHATIPGAAQSKVIIAGRSYSASVVTWFKKLYPHLATGVWASSAPLYAKVNFIEYKEIMGQSIHLVGGEQCYKRIENGIAEMEQLFDKGRGSEVKVMLQLCDTFDESNDLDLWTLFYEISDILAVVVQTHNAGKIEGVCNRIMEGADDITGVASYILEEFGSQSCNDLSYKAILAKYRNTTFSDSHMRQWYYQTCNEFGWYQTSDSKNQPFGTKYPLKLFTQMCSDIYGEQFTNTAINNHAVATNEFFGGLEPNVENVYFSQGQLDPWRAMGIQDETQATIIPLHAHCKDFGSISDKDTPELRASKQKIAGLVRQWLGTDVVRSLSNKIQF